MSKKRLIRFLIPLIMATLATVAVYLLSPLHNHQKTIPYVHIVAVAKPIAKGTTLIAQDLTMIKVPKATVTPENILQIKDVVGKVTEIKLGAGTPLDKVYLTNRSVAGLNYLIPKGKRALTIPVSLVSGVDGALHVGNHVDIMATVPSVKYGTKTLLYLADVQVGALGPNSKKYQYVTLFLTPHEAARTLLAEKIGTITLLLRPHGAISKTSTQSRQKGGVL